MQEKEEQQQRLERDLLVKSLSAGDSNGDSSALEDDTSNGSSVQLVLPVDVVHRRCDDDVVRDTEVVVDAPEAVVGGGGGSGEEVRSIGGGEEDDCVIVCGAAGGQRTTTTVVVVKRRADEEDDDDDDGPLSSSSPFSRMELADSSAINVSSLLRFPDDRSDSGVSSLRSAGSGDERSGSRSSALSSSDEPQHNQR